MRSLPAWFVRLGGLFHKERRDRELAEEIESHLQMHIEDNLRSGMNPEEAHRRALIKLGGIDQTKEIWRDHRGLPLLETILQDIRFGTRLLRKNPVFTTVAVLTLALGIGANSAIFSVVNAVLLRPLPYPEPDRLVELYLSTPGGNPRGPVSVIDFEDWREQNHVFESIALVNTLSRGLTLGGGVEPEQLATAYVHPAFFATLGVEGAVGRTLRIDDNEPGRNRVVVLSHRLWVRRFAADPSIAGRPATFDDQPFTIVGVMPAAYRFPEASIDVWAPESLIDVARAPRRRDTRYQRVIGRLRRSVTLEVARAEMKAIAGRLATQFPDTNAGFTTVLLVPLRDAIVGDSVRNALFVLLGAVVLVFLIACANVSNLFFGRTLARQGEIAVRLAIGADRPRILRQLLTESFLLALIGGALGLAAAAWSLDALLAVSLDFLPAQRDITVDRYVLGFTLLASIFSALVFGGLPALRISRSDPQRTLRQSAFGSSGGREGRRLRAALVVTETALALVLVLGALLMIRSFERLLRVDPGFDPSGLLAVFMNASSSRYPERLQYVAFYHEVLARLQQIPGVQDAGSTRNLPLRSTAEGWPVTIEGRPPVPAGSEPIVTVHQVSPDYFRVMGIRVLQGRVFADSDHGQAPGVAIVSSSMVRRFWPAENPIGRTLAYGPRRVVVVGVVGNVRQSRLDTEGQPAIYVPQVQDPRRGFTLVIRTKVDPRALAPAVRRQIRTIDSGHPILQIATMEEVLADSVAQPRLMTLLLGTLGGLALGLATVGIYGVVAYTVSLRTREFGVRMALGAQPRDVLRIVLWDGAGMALAGIAIGTAAALGLTRFLSSQLYEVSPTDVSTYIAVAGLLLVTSLAASYLPARRATCIDPKTALLCE